MKVRMPVLFVAVALCSAVALAQDGKPTPAVLKGMIKIDGSSTVFPVSAAIAEEFQIANQGVKIPVARSGTGGGFKKFVVGEIDISNASRPIKKEEQEKAGASGIEFIELPVAYDGIVIVVNPKNDFVKEITVEELKKIWHPETAAKKWSEVRKEWPDRAIHLFGAGTDSGTFDYFTEVVNGKSKVCRADYNASEDDNQLVVGVAGDQDSLGFFGYSYYHENRDKLRAVPVATAGGKAIVPSEDSITDGSYTPLARPVFVYVNAASAKRPEVREFITFYLKNATKLAPEAGMVALPEQCYTLALARFEKAKCGTMYGDGHAANATVLETLEKHK